CASAVQINRATADLAASVLPPPPARGARPLSAAPRHCSHPTVGTTGWCIPPPLFAPETGSLRREVRCRRRCSTSTRVAPRGSAVQRVVGRERRRGRSQARRRPCPIPTAPPSPWSRAVRCCWWHGPGTRGRTTPRYSAPLLRGAE